MASNTNWKRPWEDESHGQYPHLARRMSVPAAYTTSHAAYNPAFVLRSPRERRLPPIMSTIDTSVRPPGAARQQAYSQRIDGTNGAHRPLTPPDFRKRARSQYEPSQELLAQRRPSEPVRVKSNGLGHSGFMARIEEQRQMTGGMVLPKSSAIHETDDPQHHGIPFGRDKINRDSSMSPPSRQCPNCKRIGEPVHEIILGLMQLNQELRLASGITGYPSLQAPDVSLAGLKQTFDWMLHSITLDIGIARELVVTRSSPLTAITSDSGHQQSLSNSLAMPTERALKRRTDSGREEGAKRPRSGSIDMHCRIPEGPLTATSSFTHGGQSRRGSVVGESQVSIGDSPHRTTSSGLSFSQSPMQAPPPTRMLPSPSSISFPANTTTLPPISPSQPAASSHSAHAAHFQDLQHQVSTKTLALQTLQREHDTLLSAFSRSQSRCATLDKKFQVSDSEINDLNEDRMRLQGSVEGLESQVEDLIKSRDEARKQSVANGGQYLKIMAMASKLEIQGAADRQRWKSERAEFEARINVLKGQVSGPDTALAAKDICKTPMGDRTPSNADPTLDSVGDLNRLPDQPLVLGQPLEAPSSTNSVGDEALAATGDDILNSTSLEALRAEVIRLRDSCHDMEVALEDLKSEGRHIDHLFRQFGAIGKNLIVKAESATSNPIRVRAVDQPAELVNQESKLDDQGGAEITI